MERTWNPRGLAVAFHPADLPLLGYLRLTVPPPSHVQSRDWAYPGKFYSWLPVSPECHSLPVWFGDCRMYSKICHKATSWTYRGWICCPRQRLGNRVKHQIIQWIGRLDLMLPRLWTPWRARIRWVISTLSKKAKNLVCLSYAPVEVIQPRARARLRNMYCVLRSPLLSFTT